MMKFEKCHGLGNDYIYIDEATFSLEQAMKAAPELCLRGPGVGSDGIILLGQRDDGKINMRMVNADGSEGLICGNGLRCVAHLAKRWGWVEGDRMVIETAVGPRSAVLDSYTPKESMVTVEMGFPVFGTPAIKCTEEDPVQIYGANSMWHWHAVSMGNPHVVCLIEDMKPQDLDFEFWGPKVSNHEHFPGGVNANFLFLTGEGKLLSRIWERGSGQTYACGSGACAGYAVARREGWVGDKADVALPLGSLTMSWDDDKGILMKGPATWVYSGSD